MKISTKGKYALQLLLYLAQNENGEYISLSDISKNIKISKKYLEQIVSLLNKAGVLSANRGFQGGYKLLKKPEQINVYDILKITETSFLSEEITLTEENFAINSILSGFNEVVTKYLKEITLDKIAEKEKERLINNYVI